VSKSEELYQMIHLLDESEQKEAYHVLNKLLRRSIARRAQQEITRSKEGFINQQGTNNPMERVGDCIPWKDVLERKLRLAGERGKQSASFKGLEKLANQATDEDVKEFENLKLDPPLSKEIMAEREEYLPNFRVTGYET
jgi:hypothetical protein